MKNNEIIIEKVNNLPLLPGVYKFLDSYGNIIYIGKSKALKKRVKTYFAKNPRWDKVNKMLPYIEDIEYIVTDTHLEARLLECKLIKSVKPIFNSQMKNDSRYVYFKIEEFNKNNPITITHNRDENSFGPFRSKSSLYKVIESLKNLYPIEKVNGEYKFKYHLIPITMDRETYDKNRDILLELFSDNKNRLSFINSIELKMKEAASEYKFETASMYRDIISSLNYLESGIHRYKDILCKDIILKIPLENGIKLFFISKGHLVFKEIYEELNGNIYDSFIKKGVELSKNVNLSIDEKKIMDYQDIICSEILSLDNNMVNFLNFNTKKQD